MTTAVTHIQPADLGEADRALKARHRAMWALGDYPAVAADLDPRARPGPGRGRRDRPGDRVLDVAAGSGNVAIPAARTGADVVACDLTPELLAAGGRGRRRARGVELTWQDGRRGGAALSPTASSTPCCRAWASCSPRTTRPPPTSWSGSAVPGGTIGLSQLDAGGLHRPDVRHHEAVRAAAAARAPSRRRCGAARTTSAPCSATGSTTSRRDAATLRVDHFDRREAFRDYFKAIYGPTIAVYRGIADDPERVAALDDALADLGRRVRPRQRPAHGLGVPAAHGAPHGLTLVP